MFAKSPKITIINLQSNLLSGSIPNSIANLDSLSILDISFNKLNDSLPTTWPPNLQQLNLQNNLITGPLPKFLPATLQKLQLFSNSITGSIPPEWVSCTALNFIYLQNNKLSGLLPTWLGQMSALLEIKLATNQFTGSFPAGFCGSNLYKIDLTSNFLNGGINDIALTQCTSLFEFRVSMNAMGGPIPKTINNMTALNILYLDNNRFSGTFPPLASLTKLTTIHIAGNYFSGNFPSLANQKLLVNFYIHYNFFSGPVPDLSLSAGLKFYYIQNNYFSGSFINPGGVGYKQFSLKCSLFPGNPGICIDNNNVLPSSCGAAPTCSDSCRKTNNILDPVKGLCFASTQACMTRITSNAYKTGFNKDLVNCTQANSLSTSLCNCTLIEAQAICAADTCQASPYIADKSQGFYSFADVSVFTSNEQCLYSKLSYSGQGCSNSNSNTFRNTYPYCSASFNRLNVCNTASAVDCVKSLGSRNIPSYCTNAQVESDGNCNCAFMDANLVCATEYCEAFDTNCLKQLIAYDVGTAQNPINCTKFNPTTLTNSYPLCAYSKNVITDCQANPDVNAQILACARAASNNTHDVGSCAYINALSSCSSQYCPKFDQKCYLNSLKYYSQGCAP